LALDNENEDEGEHEENKRCLSSYSFSSSSSMQSVVAGKPLPLSFIITISYFMLIRKLWERHLAAMRERFEPIGSMARNREQALLGYQ